MPGCNVKNIRALRGSKAFRTVFLSGKRTDGQLVRCYCLWQAGIAAGVSTGVAIVDRSLNAVQRNHVKRRMREALRTVSRRLVQLSTARNTNLHFVVAYRGNRLQEARRVTYLMIHDDLAAVCSKIEKR
ncbi:MAG: ribonuclease P protein component [Bacteroidota bacterium]